MKLRCLFFGRMREVLGKGEAEWSIEQGIQVDQLWETEPSKAAGFEAYRSFTRLAINGTLSCGGELLSEGDEVAFLPPVSGG